MFARLVGFRCIVRLVPSLIGGSRSRAILTRAPGCGSSGCGSGIESMYNGSLLGCRRRSRSLAGCSGGRRRRAHLLLFWIGRVGGCRVGVGGSWRMRGSHG